MKAATANEASHEKAANAMRATRRLTVGLSLLSGAGTLTCCALPALFISLGMGASLASLVSAAPWLITLSEHKTTVFSVAIGSLVIAAYLQYQARNEPCATGGILARYCSFFRRSSVFLLAISAVTIGIGAYFAFGYTM